MSENASVSRQYLNQIRHYQCTLNEGSKKNTGHLTPWWIREAQLYEKATVLGQILHCSQGGDACGTSRGRALKQPARLWLQAPAQLCMLIGPTPTGSAHSGDTKGGCPRGGRLLERKDRSQQLHSVWALPAGHWGWGWTCVVSGGGERFCEEAKGHT